MDNAQKVLSTAFTVGPVVFNEAKLCRSLRNDLANLRQVKLFLRCWLKNVENKYLECWLSAPNHTHQRPLFDYCDDVIQTSKSLISDIDDIANEYFHSKDKLKRKKCLQKVLSVFSWPNPLLSNYDLVRRVNSLGDQLRQVQDNLQYADTMLNSVPKQIIIRSSTSSAIVGREADLHNVLELLMQENCEDISIIAIVALSGYGKTSLVRHLYWDHRIEEKFKLRIWIDLSASTIDLEVIGQEIILKAGKQIHENMQMKTLVKSILRDNHCLIVLDGLQGGRRQVAELREMMMIGRKTRSRILVTTHNETVAEMIGTMDPYRLSPLSPESCCKIVQNTIRCADDDKLFMEHKDGIARRCDGIPLIADFIGSVLSTGPQLSEVWRLAKEKELWKVEYDIRDVPQLLQSFRLIYYKMPQDLRQCFAYCSILPKALGIRSQNLIQQWLALELIETGHNTLPLEVIAKQYVEEIKAFFFLQPSENPALFAEDNYCIYRKIYQMHGLAYNLARSVGKKEFLLSSEGFNAKDAKDGRYRDYRHAQLFGSALQSVDPKYWPFKARSLVLQCNAMEVELICQLIAANKYLRVLDLRGCCLQEVPGCVFRLDYLRYLDVSGLPITEFSLRKNNLQQLEALDLSDTNVVELPSSISSLNMLSFLSLRGCNKLSCLPDGFGSLAKLQFLDLSNCVELRELPGSFERLRTICFVDLSGCQSTITRNVTALTSDLDNVGTRIAPSTLVSHSQSDLSEEDASAIHNHQDLDPHLSSSSSPNTPSVPVSTDESGSSKCGKTGVTLDQKSMTSSSLEQRDEEAKSNVQVNSKEQTVGSNDTASVAHHSSYASPSSSMSENAEAESAVPSDSATTGLPLKDEKHSEDMGLLDGVPRSTGGEWN
ncbi:hypothetical protein ACP70R_006651 [Stipagrostis hirtigluma subsp. patula]